MHTLRRGRFRLVVELYQTSVRSFGYQEVLLVLRIQEMMLVCHTRLHRKF